MMSFMILLLPLVTVFFISLENKKGNVKNIFSATLFGVLSGIVYSFLDVLFTFDYYLAKFSFWSNWFHFGFIEMLIPAIIITGLYILCIKNYRDMFKCLFYLLMGFFTIYMPVRIISRNTSYHYFLLFFKPALFLLALLYLRDFVIKLYKNVEKQGVTVKAILPYTLYIVGLLLVPSAIETLWLIGFHSWVWILLSFLYGIGFYTIIIMDRKKNTLLLS
jgi:hypothetical protein